MSRRNPEAELSPHVAVWLKAQRLEVYAEVPLSGRCIDLVGIQFHWDRLVTVELKMSFSAELLRSAMINQIVTEASWAAAPTKPSLKSMSIARRHGIGMLRVGALATTVLLRPDTSKHVYQPMAARVLEFCRLDEPNDIGGIACMKGRGPAQWVHAQILGFLKTNPNATWQSIYVGIPNHYAHAKSLQQSMKQLYKWRKVEADIILGKSAA